MKFFGFDIRRAKAAEDIATRAQLVPNNPQGILTPWFQDYFLRKVSGDFYEALREAIPVIDAAIRRLISLNGTVRIIGDNAALVRELEDFALNVPVNGSADGIHQSGIHAFLENFENETFEQGFALTEFIATDALDDIAELRVADSKDIVFRRNQAGRAEAWYRYHNSYGVTAPLYGSSTTLVERIMSARYGQAIRINGVWEEKLDPANKIYFSINNENCDPYGVSIMRSMEFCAKLLATMQNSLCNEWERFGDPSFHVKYKTNKRDLAGTALEERRSKLQADFDAAIRAKRAGKSADFVTAINTDAEIEIKVIGADGHVLELEVPARHVLEQIISKTGLPSWLLGINGRAVQGQATLEIEAALQDAKVRQLAMLPGLIKLFSVFLRLRGRSWKTVTTDPTRPGDWGLVFETPNVRDVVAQAQARFLNAQADQMSQGSISVTPPKTPPPKHAGGCACGHHSHGSGKISGVKEVERPTPWPELDAVETGYEDALKAEWSDLGAKILSIAKLGPVPKSAKDDSTDSLEPFTFSVEQRAAALQAMNGFIGIWSATDSDSPLRYYYGQSYSLGLIQAAHLVGQDRPLLDLIKNRDIFDRLVADGFQLVRDNATKTIQDQILREMEAFQIAGASPLSVAARLQRLFDAKNSDWERLARTEMGMAAETAKLDEWRQRKLQRVEFTPAPDACAICISVSGEYDIAACPIPGLDTHPRCRCSTRPAASESS